LPAIGDRYTILMKVRLTDVLAVPPELWRSAAGRKVQQRHVDFLLVTKKRLRIVMALELDDSSHLCEQQKQKDAYLGDSLLAAGVPLVRLPIYKRYDPKRIRGIITGVLKRHRQQRGEDLTRSKEACFINECKHIVKDSVSEHRK